MDNFFKNNEVKFKSTTFINKELTIIRIFPYVIQETELYSLDT